MMKFFKKFFSIDFWISVEENSIYNLQTEDEEHRQQINMLRVFNTSYSEKLSEQNDNPEKIREIFHFFYFKNKKNLEDFTQQIRKNEFLAISKFSVAGDENYNIGYKIMRIDKTDVQSVTAFTYLLCNLALENNGFYKGWETIAVKED